MKFLIMTIKVRNRYQ